MFKRVGISLLVLLVFLLPIQQDYAHAIATKVATKVATQAFKEVVKDAAKEKAFQMALDEVGKIYDSNNKYVFKEGYEGYCMEVIKPDGSCDKPMQLKKEVTTADTDKLDDAVTKRMDTKIGGTLYATKWGKYLDWAVPIYAISAAGIALDYAINQEDSIAGMINEIAMEALEDVGIIAPAVTKEPVVRDADENIMVTGQTTVIDSNTSTGTEWTGNQIELYRTYDPTKDTSNQGYNFYDFRVSFPTGFAQTTPYVLVHEYARTLPEKSPRNFVRQNIGTSNYAESYEFAVRSGVYDYRNVINQGREIKVNGQTIYSGTSGVGGSMAKVDTALVKSSPVYKYVAEFPDLFVANGQQRQSVQNKMIFQENGDIITERIEAWNNQLEQGYGYSFRDLVYKDMQTASKISIFIGGHMSFEPFIPKWEKEAALLEVVPLDKTAFRKDAETLKFPPIDAMTITDSATGTPGTITKNPVTGETSITSPTGEPIPDDNIDVKPGTGYEKTPEGITYTPGTPTTENPTKEPVTIPNEGTTTEPGGGDGTTPPPTGTEEPPLEPFPEGESCQEKLKFPIFSPLKEQLSTSFPFSIPWDIERAAHAAFDGVGSEKPSFDLVIPIFGGETHTVKIATPEFMDKWKPFMDGVLLLTFDMLLMFGLYRFVKGAGS